MTETSISNTHPTANLFPATASALPSPDLAINPTYEDEEEPYTIKCICAFQDDDGSTVFCERCETWQHIICYYSDKDVPDIHNCADCEPRDLDAKRATERQKRLREQSDGGDRKGKRSGSKSQRKKAKDPPVEQPNGWTSQEKEKGDSRRDLPPPAKKPRHHASVSLSSLTGTSDARKRRSSSTGTPTATAPQTKTPLSPYLPQVPLYSPEFIHLYDNDEVNVDMPSNLFDTITLAGDLASWAQDPSALARVANGRSPKDVFTHSDQPLDPSKWPKLSRQLTTDTSVDYNGRNPMWKYLRVESGVRKDEIVGEVRGKVGHFRDYCLDPNSRWKELRHPEPFVFFHPQLPIYIDSRQEGTQLRYIRRSCRPNVTMKTFITNQVEYHFCFVANQDIPENTEITTTWYLDPQMFPSNGKLVKQEGSNDGIPDAAALSISNVLAHFGGCACDSSQPCLLAKVDLRRPPPKSIDPSQPKQANGKRKRSKPKNATSPSSTGHATNSRAGSEAPNVQEDDDLAETRSTSGSTQDQPRSRDMTPTGLNSVELSARERRKIAAVEKKFEQLEHDQQNQRRKKRYTSQGTSSAGANTSKSNSISNGPASRPPRLDTTFARRTSGSPTKMSPAPATPRQGSHLSGQRRSGSNTPRVGSPLIHRVYVDSGMQTDPDENDPLFIPPKPVRRHGFVPLTQRLLKRCHEDRRRLEEPAQADDTLNHRMISSVPLGLVSAATPTKHAVPQHNGQEDVEMKDADTAITPPRPSQPVLKNSSSSSSLTMSENFPPSLSTTTTSTTQTSLHSLPSTVAHTLHLPRKPGAGLRVQLPPSQFSPSAVSTPLTASKMNPPSLLPNHSSNLKPSTPLADPGTSVVAPSPVKKKLTLGDYMSRRGNLATPTAEKSQSQLEPAGHHTPTYSADGSSPTVSLTGGKSGGESIKQESPATPDAVMKDVQISSTTTEISPSLPRDPRLQPRT